MCVAQSLQALPIVDTIGQSIGMDPFGSRARAKEDARNQMHTQWAREDEVRQETFAHQRGIAQTYANARTDPTKSSNRNELSLGRQ